MKLVLDKFLWIGLGIVLFGFYQVVQGQISNGISWIVAGAIVLFLFIVLILGHYEINP